MKPQRWQEIDSIFAAALEREPAARSAFLDEACSGDGLLRKEVESLLAHDQPESLVGAAAVEEATRLSHGTTKYKPTLPKGKRVFTTTACRLPPQGWPKRARYSGDEMNASTISALTKLPPN